LSGRAEDAGSMPYAPISWGELIDKVTILEIKHERLEAEMARSNVARELELLEAVVATAPEGGGLTALRAELRRVNETLWDLENQVRAKEAQGDFGAQFVGLARAVYRVNDERSRLKRAINIALASALIEEKFYEIDPSGHSTDKVEG
jgi:hypothetical protein